jgi:hypothetical protein
MMEVYGHEEKEKRSFDNWIKFLTGRGAGNDEYGI